MNTIWKFSLEPKPLNTIFMPSNAEILTFSSQDNEICFWAKINSESPFQNRTFSVFGTGHELPDTPLIYLATVQIKLPKAFYNLSEIVWHVFEVPCLEKGGTMR